MSMHNTPLTLIEREGLEKHGLPIGKPSQLSDTFRLGIAWALAQQGEPCKVCEEVHALLDSDESMIIRNAADGYPEGREPRVLTLQERVSALCTYAADWKRWYLETQAAPRAQQVEPVGFWEGEFSKDGGAMLCEVPQESVFGRKYRNIPLYAAAAPAAQETIVRYSSPSHGAAPLEGGFTYIYHDGLHVSIGGNGASDAGAAPAPQAQEPAKCNHCGGTGELEQFTSAGAPTTKMVCLFCKGDKSFPVFKDKNPELAWIEQCKRDEEPAPQPTQASGRTNPGDETGGAVERFGWQTFLGKSPEIVPATNGSFVWYSDYLKLWQSAQLEDGCAPNHMCNGHRVHIPTGECCNKCGATSWVTTLQEAAPQAQQPLTNEQIKAGRTEGYDAEDAPDAWDFEQGVRFAERHHGIGEKR